MNATFHLTTARPVSPRPARFLSVFAAILITLRGLLGPDEESADDPAAIAYIHSKYGGAGD